MMNLYILNILIPTLKNQYNTIISIFFGASDSFYQQPTHFPVPTFRYRTKLMVVQLLIPAQYDPFITNFKTWFVDLINSMYWGLYLLPYQSTDNVMVPNIIIQDPSINHETKNEGIEINLTP